MSFAADVGKWASQTEERLTAVYRRSIELLAEDMITTRPQGGRVPFLTGNLARSLLASTTSMPKIAEGPYDGSNVGIIAATLKLDQAVYIGYQAAYARRMNNGFIGQDSLGRNYNQTGHYFVEGAVANWQNTVTRAVSEVRS